MSWRDGRDTWEPSSASRSAPLTTDRDEAFELTKVRRLNRYLLAGLLAGLLLAAGLAVGLLMSSSSTTHAPDIIGMSLEQAEAELKPLGLSIKTAEPAAGAAGSIITAQAPKPGVPLDGQYEISAVLKAPAAGKPGVVIVPKLKGLAANKVKTVLTVAGLKFNERVLADAGSDPSMKLVEQSPKAGTKVKAGTRIKLSFGPGRSSAPPPATVTPKPPQPKPVAAPKPKPVASSGLVVCLDPGHQSGGDGSQEPVGPGSSETKPAYAGGASGVSTGRPEYAIVLEISKRIRSKLQARGVRVIMTRTSNDSSITNIGRAKMANAAGADLFLRIHCDGSSGSSARGISTLYPGGNDWVAPIKDRSLRAADLIQAAVLRSTGANDRGINQRSDLAGFNWSKVPSVLVECGFLSNPTEDRLLSDPVYQDKLASGIAQGTMSYLK